MIYKNILIATHEKEFLGWIEIDDQGKVINIQEGSTNKKGIDARDKVLLPLFVEIHTHGGYGFSLEKFNLETNYHDYFKNTLINEGVGYIILSSVAQDQKELLKIGENLSKYFDKPISKVFSEFIGWHLEGPFISKVKKGAHNEEFITPMNSKFLKQISELNVKNILITVAPEIKKNLNLLEKYKNDFIFSLGHSNATYDEAKISIEKGIKKTTHFFNAMSGFHHRNTGIINYVLTENPNIFHEIIPDSFHVDDSLVKLAFQFLGSEKIIVISDSLSPKGLNDGQYFLDKIKIEKKGSKIFIENTNIPAGSGFLYNSLLKNFKRITNCSWKDIVKVSSYNSLKLLNLENFSPLKKGEMANFLIIDKNFNIKKILKNGVEVK